MTFSEQFPIVLQALNVGFLQTLKLFAVTLIGAIPLGLIISFGSMSSWAPFGFLRPYVMKNGTPTERLTGWQRFQLWWVVDFKPIRLLTRFVIWIVRGSPLMLQLLIIYYFPGLVCGNNIWGSGEAGASSPRRSRSCSTMPAISPRSTAAASRASRRDSRRPDRSSA